MNLNMLLTKLIAKGLASEPPAGVIMPDYPTLKKTSEGTGWAVPSLELLISVKAEVELDAAKEVKIALFQEESFQKRQALIPDYKLQNASLGVYGETKKQEFINLVNKFRDEFYRLRGLVGQAKNIAEINAIKSNFPVEL